jgi:hypothetical protein
VPLPSRNERIFFSLTHWRRRQSLPQPENELDLDMKTRFAVGGPWFAIAVVILTIACILAMEHFRSRFGV